MCRSISMLFALVVVALCSVSCASTLYHQVATITSLQGEINEDGLYVVENDVVKVQYDFWGLYGKVKFQITNKTDEEIKIDLTRSYYIRNSIARDYWIDQPYVNIPAYCSIVMGDFVIADTPYRDCGLARNPKQNEDAQVSFSIENSPIVIENRLLVIKANEEQSLDAIFYISGIRNYPINSVVKHGTYKLDCSGESVYDPQIVYMMQYPSRYYVEYVWKYGMPSDRVHKLYGF